MFLYGILWERLEKSSNCAILTSVLVYFDSMEYGLFSMKIFSQNLCPRQASVIWKLLRNTWTSLSNRRTSQCHWTFSLYANQLNCQLASYSHVGIVRVSQLKLTTNDTQLSGEVFNPSNKYHFFTQAPWHSQSVLQSDIYRCNQTSLHLQLHVTVVVAPNFVTSLVWYLVM